MKAKANSDFPMAMPSDPIIFKIKNKTNKTIRNSKVLKAVEFLGHSGFKNGTLTVGGLELSSGKSNVTYQHILWGTALSRPPIVIGLTYVHFATKIPKQLVLVVEQADMFGTQLHRQLRVDEEKRKTQVQMQTFVFEKEYSIDGETALMFNEIPPRAEMTVFLYIKTPDALDKPRKLAAKKAIKRTNVVVVPAAKARDKRTTPKKKKTVTKQKARLKK